MSGNRTFRPFVSSPPGRFAPKTSCPWTYSTFPSHSIILSFIFKLRLTTFITANDGDDPAYSVKTQAPGGETSSGRTDEGAKRP